MSDLGKLRVGAKEAIGRTSSWQRWLTLHLKTVTSEPPPAHKNSQVGSEDRGEGFLAVPTDIWNVTDKACQTSSAGDQT
jgi:hypothetical protein